MPLPVDRGANAGGLGSYGVLLVPSRRPVIVSAEVVQKGRCEMVVGSGCYRLARLAERYGANIRLTELLNMLSADCKLRGGSKGFAGSHLTCGAIFPDLGKGGPPDTPPATPLRVVGRRE